MTKRNKKAVIVSILVVVLLAALVFCVLLPYRHKTKAPTSTISTNSIPAGGSIAGTSQTSQQTGAINANSNTTTSNNFDNKGEATPTAQTPTIVDNSSTDPYYYYDLGRAEFAKNNCQEAINYFDKAIALNPTNPNFYTKKSEAQIALGQKQVAIDTINQGLEKLPGNDLLLSQLDFIKNVVK